MSLDQDSRPIRLDEGFFGDPEALYRELRVDRPVARAAAPNGMTFWIVSRYADARAALNDARLSKDAKRIPDLLADNADAPPPRALAESLVQHMLNADPPDHTRLRKLVGKAFTMRAIARLRPRIEELAGELADVMAAAGPSVDLLDEFAFPLPMTVICEILGVPQERREEFRHWSNTLLSGADDEERGAAAGAMAQFLAAARRGQAREPGRRHALRDRPRLRGRRHAQSRRDDRDGVPAARRRARDDGQPDRQRDARPAAPPRPARPRCAGTRTWSRAPSRSSCATTGRSTWPRSGSPPSPSRSPARRSRRASSSWCR